MNQLFFLVFGVFCLFTGCASQDKKATVTVKTDEVNHAENNPKSNGTKMKIKVGTSTFTATLLDNPTVAAFKSMLPLTLDMIELNGNEKYFNLSTDLPTNASNPRTIQSGDLMLYGDDTVVLFYKSFSTSYSYTRLGRINNPEGLAAALGAGHITVTFELE